MGKELNINWGIDVGNGLNLVIQSIVGRVSTTLTFSHSNNAEVNVHVKVKKNSENRFDAGYNKCQLLSPKDYGVLYSPRRSYANYFNIRVCNDE